MANLNFNQRQLFEKLFARGGYVLNFSDRTFSEFFQDFPSLPRRAWEREISLRWVGAVEGVTR